MIEYRIQFAELIFRIYSERELTTEESVLPFCYKGVKEPDICVYVSWDWKEISFSEGECLGEDVINRYYEAGDEKYCVTRGGYKGDVAYTVYDKGMCSFKSFINEKNYSASIKSIGGLLRILPMKEIFIHHNILFFHSSQVSYKGKGIVFTAPSGTGKTTQAKLWEKYRNAEIICNDRTLVRKKDGVWYTYGYPVDGSEPVRSSAVNELGCPVLLSQSKDNHVEKLTVVKAVANLMSQLVLNAWSSDDRTKATELLLALVESRPVLWLNCTKDKNAVETLEKILIESRIIDNGEDIG